MTPEGLNMKVLRFLFYHLTDTLVKYCEKYLNGLRSFEFKMGELIGLEKCFLHD